MQIDHAPDFERVPKPIEYRTQRRYDVDWLRTLALGLLIVYHIVVSFQPWASYIYFIQNDEPLEGLWIVMSMINVWRIPILFLISGMGVRFAMQRRNWRQLLKDRVVRILLPLGFGYFFIGPIVVLFLVRHYYGVTIYKPDIAHLWFLGNIFAYVLILLPVFSYLKNRPDNIVLRSLSSLLRQPLTLLVIAVPLMLEAIILAPGEEFVRYAGTWHGFWLGMVCFLTGFIFVSIEDAAWQAAEDIRWPALAVAVGLYLLRLLDLAGSRAVDMRFGLESMCWMLAILGFGSLYLNRPSGSLGYLSKAVYPVYIVHMPVQFALSYFLIPLSWPAWAKLLVLVSATFAISILLYEAIKRIRWIRPLFGMKH